MLDPCQKAPEKKKTRKQNGALGPRCRWIVTEWIVTAWSFGNCTDVWGNVSRQPGEPGGAGDSWWGMKTATNGDFFTQNAGRMAVTYDVFIEIWIEQVVYPLQKRAGSWKNPPFRGPLAAPNWLRDQADEIPGS